MRIRKPAATPGAVLVIGSGALALQTAACRLVSGSNVVEWMSPALSSATAREAVSKTRFVAHNRSGALDRLIVTGAPLAAMKSCAELWLIHPGAALNITELLDAAFPIRLNLVCGVGEQCDEVRIAGLCAQRGVEFGLFRVGWVIGENTFTGGLQPNPAEQFLAKVHEFKSEIEERIPDYFEFHALRCLDRQGHGPFLADAEATARALVEAASGSPLSDDCLLMAGPSPGTFAELCDEIGEAFGMSLLAARRDSLSLVDEVFEERTEAITAKIVVSDSMAASNYPLHFDQEARRAALRRLKLELDGVYQVSNQRCQALFSCLDPQPVKDSSGLEYFRGGQCSMPVVLINALGQGLDYWSRLFDILSRDHRVLIWELRGVPSPPEFCLDDHAADLERILECEGASECHLVGWCTGAKLALEVYRRRPHAVKSMVFLNPSFKGPGLAKELDGAYERHLEPLCSLLDRSPHMVGFVRNAIHDSLGGNASEDKSTSPSAALSTMNSNLRQHVLRPFRSDPSTLSYCRQLLDFWATDAAALAANVKVPILILSAEYDQVASPAMARAVRDLFEKADLVEIRGDTHYCLYDQPVRVAGLIQAFLQRTSAESAGISRMEEPEQGWKENAGHQVAS